MPSYENSIVINAPVGKVFAYVGDPTTSPEWLSSMVDVHNVIGSGEGQQYEWTFKMVGVTLHGQSTTVSYVPDECASFQSIGMIESVWTHCVEPIDEGTELTMRVEYGIPIPVLGKLAEHLTLKRNKRALNLALVNIKETLESREPSKSLAL